MNHNTRNSAFTLIELSIVLVIIGLIVGGVLVGRDLISAAAVRAQISQIDKYQQAVNTFRGKYGYLPGDIKDPDATQFGFQPRGQYAGEGDGNGIIEGIASNAAGQNNGNYPADGEQGMFWVDLSTARLLDGQFSTVTPTVIPGVNTNMPLYFPSGKLGTTFLYVWSGIADSASDATSPFLIGGTLNYFGLSAVTQVHNYVLSSAAGITVAQAYAIDSKIDDGLPQSGKVLAVLQNTSAVWAAPSLTIRGVAYTFGVPAASGTCYDNGNVSGAQKYSITNPVALNQTNCGLSFRFQ